MEKTELERTLQELSASDVGAEIQGKIATKGLCATYDDGLKYIQEGRLTDNMASDGADSFAHYKVERAGRDASPSSTSSGTDQTHSMTTDMTPPSTPGAEEPPYHILFLGSSLGNFQPGEDAVFVRSLPLKPGSGNTLLIGLDHTDDGDKIHAAYNDQQGITRDFIMNGLKNAGRVLGDESLFDQSKWEYVGKYNEELREFDMFCKLYSATNDVLCQADMKLTTDQRKLRLSLIPRQAPRWISSQTK